MARLPITRIIRWLFTALAAVALLIAVIAATTPLGRYIARAGWEEARILGRRQRIDALVRDSTTPAPLRDRLALVQTARTFAAESLGLDAGESFTTYARLDRDTLVLVLTAAYKDRLEAYRWWFPVVGRLPYKGYFDVGQAARMRDNFRARGFDTYLRPASAFSTLGWFNDPLLSTTLGGDTTWLVNTVIHELSHNTLFVKGNAEFSESFASFIGARGAEAFFRSRGSVAAADQVMRDWNRDQLLGAFWQATAAAIDSAYAAWPADSARRVEARDSVYARARRFLVDSLAPRMAEVRPDWFATIQLDNASLLARRVYAQRLDLFDSVWVRNERNVRKSIAVIRSAVKGETAPFDAMQRLAR